MRQNRRIISLVMGIVFGMGASGCVVLQGAESAVVDGHFPRKIPYSKRDIRNCIDNHFASWQGVPYRASGYSKSGIDCSGFVWRTFRDLFYVSLPRTTTLMARVGEKKRMPELEYGDLVFFKTGRATSHVGIYVGTRHFIHASTTHGVIKSSLDAAYWKKHYWKSTRVIESGKI